MIYGLSDAQRQEIIQFIAAYPEVEEAILFGSRALGTYKPASDVDIALKGPGVTASLAARLKFDIEEDTYLPYFFDFVAYPTITREALKAHIDGKGVCLYRKVGSPALSLDGALRPKLAADVGPTGNLGPRMPPTAG
jgi:predicted nucleotidyltransferase